MAFPIDPLSITVEFFIDGAWVDVTSVDDDTHVLGLEGRNAITIQRGGRPESGRTPPTTVQFQYQDNNGLLNEANPLSTYWRKVGQYTPVRISVGSDIRAVVELASLEPDIDELGNVVLDVQAAGLLKRLGQGQRQKPLRSAAYRALTAPENDADRVAYWPLEEESEATQITAYQGLGSSSFTSEGVNFGAYTESLSSERMVTFGADGLLFFTVPTYSSVNHKVSCLWTLPETSLAANTVLMRMYCTDGQQTNNVDFIDLHYRSSVDGDLSLKAYRGGALLDTAGLGDFSATIVQQHFYLTIQFEDSGSDTDCFYGLINMTDTGMTGSSDTFSGVTIGRISHIAVAETDCDGASFGQLIVGTDVGAFANYDEAALNIFGVQGYRGETASIRMQRLSDEEGVPFSLINVGGASGALLGGDTPRMGPQRPLPYLDLMYECVDADGGFLYDKRDELEIEYRTRSSMYSQGPTVSLTYSNPETMTRPFKPTTDDLGRRNDVTMHREQGGSARYVIPDDDPDHYSTQDPPDGMGVVDAEFTPNVELDSDLNEQAAWSAHLGSWRGQRFPSVSIDLSSDALVDDPTLTAAVLELNVGDWIAGDTTGAPRWIPPGEVRMIAGGYLESLGQFQHFFTFNTFNADPWEVEVVDANSVLANVIDDNDTTVRLAITDDGPPWSTTDEPYYIQIDGDAMKVTSISTSTPAHIATGTAAYADNASVQPSLPAGMTPDVGQLMILFAACRATGSGVIDDTITGWTLIIDDVDINVFAKYYVTGDSAPTVTTSGGAAGNTVGAVIAAFSGLSMNLDKNDYTGNYPNGWVNSVNGSAQNIAYPRYLNRRTNSAMMIWGKKDDDWTSVGTVAGTSELADTSSTTGNDIGIVWDFYNPGTPTVVAAGSFTVTGGASAVSEGIVAGFRPLQTATVERNVNGAATSHTPGDEVRVWRSGVNAL